MKKACLLLCSLLCIVLMCRAQDTITLTNGKNILAKVLEINPESVRYKDYNNQDGPVIVIFRNGVVSIKYANGTQTTFATTDGNRKNGDNSAGYKKAMRKNGHVHGWYFGASLGIGNSNASSSDPAYSVTGFVYSGDGLVAVKMFNQHVGIMFGLGSDDYTYRVNFNNSGANSGYLNTDIFTISCLTVPVRFLYLSNSKSTKGLYVMAGVDFSLVASANDENNYNITNYYNGNLISPYVSAGFEFHTRNAATVFFAGPYFKTSLGNIYSDNTNNSLGLNPGNKGSLTTFGLSISCMTNFGRRR